MAFRRFIEGYFGGCALLGGVFGLAVGRDRLRLNVPSPPDQPGVDFFVSAELPDVVLSVTKPLGNLRSFDVLFITKGDFLHYLQCSRSELY